MDNYKNNKYWLTALLLTIIGLAVMYTQSPFASLKMEITTEEAVEKAKKFLSDLDYNISDYTYEATINNNNNVSGYIIQNYGNDVFSEKVAENKIPLHGWRILFHQNLSPGTPAVTYNVTLTYDGWISSFRRDIPDTASIPSVDQVLAEEKIMDFLKFHTNINIADYEKIKVREDNFGNRFDYHFEWEKALSQPEGKLKIDATIQGNEPGSFRAYYEIPPNSLNDERTIQTLFGTFSFIFVFFLAQFAIFIFIKKYHSGEIWLSTGKILLIAFYIISFIGIINAWPALGEGVGTGTNIITKKIVVLISAVFLVYVLLALLIFSAWAVGESFSREIWREKLEGIDAFIKGKFFTNQSGPPILKGIVLGNLMVLAYGLLSMLINWSPEGAFFNPTGYLSIYNTYLPALSVFTDAITESSLTAIVLTFFIVNITYQKWHNKWLSVVLSALVYTASPVISVSLPSVNIFSYDLLLDFSIGVVFGLIYFRFGLLSLVSTQITMILLKGLAVLIAGQGTFFNINSIVVFMLYFGFLAVYFISRYRNEDFMLEDYGMPSHIERISERARMKKELEIASKVQLSLLPKENPVVEGYDIAGVSIPAKEAGGDYYDFVSLDKNQLGIAIGDVSGKGVGAAIYMTLTKGILQAHAEENVSPKMVLSKVNRLLYKTIEKNSFVSMFYAILDTTKHSLLYSRAGHNPGILCSDIKGDTRFLKSSGMALGLEEGQIFKRTLVEESINIESGDVLVLYTDGFTEAMNEKLEEYGEEKFTKIIVENRKKSSKEILDIIMHDVDKFIDHYPQHDDMTIVVLKRD